ncbi:MAG: hypothetical protein NTZ97_03035 [Candidatus Moranbacteria bacterium]|nr:hypothetical protein [Candidatus Moranbacteria bacterium]
MKKIVVLLAIAMLVVFSGVAMAGGHHGGHRSSHHGDYGGGYYGGGYNYGGHFYGGGGYYNKGSYWGGVVVVPPRVYITPVAQCWEETRNVPAYDRYGNFIGYVPQRVTVCQ